MLAFQDGTTMLRLLESMSRCPDSSGRGSALVESRRAWGQRTTLYVLSSLGACCAATLIGCGEDSSPVVTPETKEKQAVVQEKQKEFMQQKMKTKGAKR